MTTADLTADVAADRATIDAATADVLARAAVLVRTRTERGTPTTDRRPRLREAIDHATAQICGGAHRSAVRERASRLAARQVDKALGRGERTNDLADCEHTLSGFGLDVGTLGAVDWAADLLDAAARTAADSR